MTEPTKPAVDAADPLAPPDVPVTNDGLTVEQSGKIAEVLFHPTVQRMHVLMQTLVTTTGNGDYAIWSVIAAMDQTIRELKWEAIPSVHARMFADMARLAFEAYGKRLADYRSAIETWEAHKRDIPNSAAPFPLLIPWGDDDTLAVFREVDKLYPKDAPAAAAGNKP